MGNSEDDEAMRLAYARFPLEVVEIGEGMFNDLNEGNRLLWLEGFIGGYLSSCRDHNDLSNTLQMVQAIQATTLETIRSPETARKFLEDAGIIRKASDEAEEDNLWCDVRDIFIHDRNALQRLPHKFKIKRK